MFNLVVLTGRLTAEPELKQTNSGVSVISFCIAVQRQYKSGEEAITDFINIQAWRSNAEFIAKYFKRGSMIGIEGSIQTRKYTDKEGNNRTAFEILASNVQFVESKRNESVNVTVENSSIETGQFTDVGNIADDDLPF